jgi:hypothetical protein
MTTVGKTGGRWAEVGDIIIQKRSNYKTDRGRYPRTGVVYKLEVRRGNEAAYIHWTPVPPPDYNINLGTLRTNLHNLYDTYDIIKK